ncbi:hypothetical protein O1611_g8479 [Lasiodiplodia mahajangana]|uniref:Uncharacterized protein n=1 Tax=Lasiodiplodia mahajangana TaxID=1108764 RepID=A0ACC2JCP7_9PEZI|nr:hypothetical protein O1611_g8479 [Lasiodiplodia mahajangana]
MSDDSDFSPEDDDTDLSELETALNEELNAQAQQSRRESSEGGQRFEDAPEYQDGEEHESDESDEDADHEPAEEPDMPKLSCAVKAVTSRNGVGVDVKPRTRPASLSIFPCALAARALGRTLPLEDRFAHIRPRYRLDYQVTIADRPNPEVRLQVSTYDPGGHSYMSGFIT